MFNHKFQSQYGLILVSVLSSLVGIFGVFQSQYGLILVTAINEHLISVYLISIPIWSDFSVGTDDGYAVFSPFQSQYGLILVIYDRLFISIALDISIPIWSDFSFYHRFHILQIYSYFNPNMV